MHLFNDNVVIDLSQNAHRARLRSDGCIPALTTSGRKLFFPKYAFFLSAQQSLCLQGIEEHMINCTDLSTAAVYRAAGNAISVPVLSALLVVILQELGVETEVGRVTDGEAHDQ